jgi:hypothetical protein
MARKNPHAVALGRLGGSVRSTAKRKAARKNAKRGGRPVKFQMADRVRVNDKAPTDYRDRIGTIFKIGPGRSEYGVEFGDDGTGNPSSGYLMSWWLDRAEK